MNAYYQHQADRREIYWNRSITNNRSSIAFFLLASLLLSFASSFFFLLLPTSALSFLDADTASVPSPIVATWISLQQRAASETDGIPSPRCDHSMMSLTGRALKPNMAVPFSTVTPAPKVDPYNKHLWIYSGHEDDGYHDSWLLDLNQDIPTWTLTHLDQILPPRWGVGLTTIPMSVNVNESGLTGMIFGGYSNDGYFGTVDTINFMSEQQQNIMPTKIADDYIFPRGYCEWVALPVGSGSQGKVKIDNTVDSGLYYQINGVGPSNGMQWSDADHDTNDEWIFDLKQRTWTPIGLGICARNQTTCTDSISFNTILKSITSQSSVAGQHNFTDLLRPSEVYPAVEALQQAIQSSPITSNTYTDTTGACTTTCAEYEPDTRLKPPAVEGSRMIIHKENLYNFGGYLCNVQGQQAKGGDACYTNTMYVMNLSTYEWRKIDPPSTDSVWSQYWPSSRAYHSMTIVPSRNLIFIEGGAYQDSSGSYYFYNSIFAFDTVLEMFVPLTIKGIPPPIHWSAGTAAEGSDLYFYGGCQGTTYYDTLMVLKLDVEVKAKNCDATGQGLSVATAGQSTSFYIQTREVIANTNTNATTNTSSSQFGANATYGTGLVFSVSLVASNTPSGIVSLLSAKVVELGGGLYKATYLATYGSEYQIFITLDDELIPSSPMTMRLKPKADMISPSKSESGGNGIKMTAKGKSASVLVQIKDEYGNPFFDASFLKNCSSTSASKTLNFTAFMNSIEVPLIVTNYNNGSYSLTYEVPASIDSSYSLAIKLNDEPLFGSPYLVSTLDPILISQSIRIVFWVLTALNIAICLIASGIIVKYRHETVIRASSPRFLQLLIFGSVLSSLSVLFLSFDSETYGCRSFHAFLSIGFVMSMASLLAKSTRVARIFNTAHLRVQHNNSDARLMIPTVGVIAIMLLLNLLWIGINPVYSTLIPSSNKDHASVLSFNVCAGANDTEWIAGMLGYVAIILVYGVYLAINTGSLPDQFNESKVIAGATYNLFIMSIIIVPLLFFLGQSSDFLTGRFVILSLGILWCSCFNVVALIGPKLWVLLRTKGRLSGSNHHDEVHTIASGVGEKGGKPPLSTYMDGGTAMTSTIGVSCARSAARFAASRRESGDLNKTPVGTGTGNINAPAPPSMLPPPSGRRRGSVDLLQVNARRTSSKASSPRILGSKPNGAAVLTVAGASPKYQTLHCPDQNEGTPTVSVSRRLEGEILNGENESPIIRPIPPDTTTDIATRIHRFERLSLGPGITVSPRLTMPTPTIASIPSAVMSVPHTVTTPIPMIATPSIATPSQSSPELRAALVNALAAMDLTTQPEGSPAATSNP